MTCLALCLQLETGPVNMAHVQDDTYVQYALPNSVNLPFCFIRIGWKPVYEDVGVRAIALSANGKPIRTGSWGIT